MHAEVGPLIGPVQLLNMGLHLNLCVFRLSVLHLSPFMLHHSSIKITGCLYIFESLTMCGRLLF